jgi:flagellar basal-body rod protein FlgB
LRRIFVEAGVDAAICAASRRSLMAGLALRAPGEGRGQVLIMAGMNWPRFRLLIRVMDGGGGAQDAAMGKSAVWRVARKVLCRNWHRVTAAGGDVMKNLLDRDLMRHQSALNLQAYRQQLLASNIANADTPFYKARDIEFGAALDEALGRRRWGGALALATSHPAHINGAVTQPTESFVRYRGEWQSAVDGNTVNMDVERAEFARNSVHYEASVTFINGLLRSMQTAISGQ